MGAPRIISPPHDFAMRPAPGSQMIDFLRDKGFPYRQLNFENCVHSQGEPFHNFLRSAADSPSWRQT
jgi:hypothetical protein